MAQKTASRAASTLTLPSDREIQIDREFSAPRQLVWRAFTDPKLLPNWMGPAKYKMTHSEMDVRRGGKYRWTWAVPEMPGGTLVIHGVFVEVDRPERLVTDEYMDPFPEPSRNVMTLTESDGRTTVSIRMRLKDQQARDAALATGMKDGMDEGYARLDALLKDLE